jgi:hypothetical protein
MDRRTGRRRALQSLVALALAPASGRALDGADAAPTRQFGVVGSFCAPQDTARNGFPGTQIAPSWVLTAAHVAPAAGRRYVNDFGDALVAETVGLARGAPTQPPFDGALRDDLVLVRLAAAIPTPYLPRLMDDEAFLRRRANSDFTLVSNNPRLQARRVGYGALRAVTRRSGFDFLIIASRRVQLAGGDSGSALFLGHLARADGDSVLVGVASARSTDQDGASIAVYTRVGVHRGALDAAVGAAGEQLTWKV